MDQVISKAKLYEALAKAQNEMECALKDSTNPHFKSKFASLSSIWEASQEALSKNGLCVTQTIAYEGDKTVLVTTLGHSSGEEISSKLPLIIPRADMQSLGSAITYARRYALAAILCIAVEDDDGETATQRSKAPEYISDDDLLELRLAINGNKELEEKILDSLDIKSLNKIPQEKVAGIKKGVATYLLKKGAQ